MLGQVAAALQKDSRASSLSFESDWPHAFRAWAAPALDSGRAGASKANGNTLRSFERERRMLTEPFGLLRVSTHGDWTSWLTYFLEGVRVQAANAADLADRLLGLQTYYRAVLQSSRRTANALALVDHLFVNPIVSASSVQRALELSAVLVGYGVGTQHRGARYATPRRG